MGAWDLNTRTDASHGNFAQIVLDLNLITGQVDEVDGDFDRASADGAGIGSKVERNLYGIAKGVQKIKAKYSPTMDFRLEKLKRRQAPFNTAIAPKGLSAGMPVAMMPACFGKYSPKVTKKDEVTVDMELGAQGDFHNGRVAFSPKTLVSATGVGPEDDNTTYDEETVGITSFGGAAYLWLINVVGGTSPTVTAKVTNATSLGGSYTDVTGGGFAAASMGNAASRRQLIYIPSTTSIQAFTQIAYTITGTPTSVQMMIGVARDYDPAAVA